MRIYYYQKEYPLADQTSQHLRMAIHVRLTRIHQFARLTRVSISPAARSTSSYFVPSAPVRALSSSKSGLISAASDISYYTNSVSPSDPAADCSASLSICDGACLCAGPSHHL